MIRDLLGRPLKNLRLSVTDRCNLRCSYCMPEAEYVWLPRHDILQFEEMSTLIDVFARAGVDRVRLTGGEPLLRRDLPDATVTFFDTGHFALETHAAEIAEAIGAFLD